MDSRNDEQRGPRLSSPDGMDGQSCRVSWEVRCLLGFRERVALFGRQIVEPEAENKECRDG